MNRMNGSQRDSMADLLEKIAADGTEGLEVDAALDAMAETLLPDTIERYFEAHITVEPEGDYGAFASAMLDVGWRASKFEHDDVDQIVGKWFISARDPSYSALHNAVLGMVHGLSCNTEVLRYKIEETLLDSKCGDKL